MSKYDPTLRYKFMLFMIIISPFLILLIWYKDTYLESKTDTTTITQTFHQKQTLANPASVYCSEKGGTNQIITIGNGAQDGLCQFPDNMACEEWAMMRGECPIGGIKTTGYDNEGQIYCAWLGGKTLAVKNSICTLPKGNTCSTDALWNGTCN